MRKKLTLFVVLALVLGLALASVALAKKPDPMPGPQVVTSFDGDAYLFTAPPALATDPWGKISFDLWGEKFKFSFKAANLAPGTTYTLSVGGLVLGSFATGTGTTGTLSGEVDSESFTNQDVTLTGGAQTLTSFYPISFIFIEPAL